jgi:hypothetical protein
MFSTAMRLQRPATVTGGVQQRSTDSEIPFVTTKITASTTGAIITNSIIAVMMSITYSMEQSPS